ncbi:DUF998 domain-containing protein [Saccharopolyspora shandongensis]|uniref:DUF998 domain-containing protein n=1 Tax=Saccharopolyspora shandongensis TaxID=418495 RepID=UPI0033C519D6
MSVRPDRTTRVLLSCGFAPLLFIVVILVQGVLRAGYDPLHHWGSELSLGDQGWIQITNFIATGALTIAFAAGARRALAGGRGSAAIPVLTGILGLCLIVQGVFVTDPYVGYPVGSQGTAEPTLHGWVHGLNMFPTFGVLTAAVLTTAYRSARRPGELAWAVVSVIAAILIPTTLYFAATAFDMDTQTGQYHGVWQRISLGIVGVWYALFAVRLLRQGSGARPQVERRSNEKVPTSS